MSGRDTTGQQEGIEHLALVRALSREVSSAISAIERNDLTLLTNSVAAQEAICQKLNRQGTEWLRLACASYRASVDGPVETPMMQTIREAHLGLAHLNRIYAGLVRRSQRSIELITALYRNYGQGYAKTPNNRTSNHTWSCEA